jgi:hypothetical protein
MSNEPITEQDIKKVNKKHLKMIGRIETVRCETATNRDGDFSVKKAKTNAEVNRAKNQARKKKKASRQNRKKSRN